MAIDCCSVNCFLSGSGTPVLVCVQPFPLLPGFKNGSFDYCEDVALDDYRVMPLTGQLVACRLLMSHIRIDAACLEH